MGFAAIGNNVSVSDKASFYNCRKISLGSNVRIDDFCVISAGIGGIQLGDYIHVAVFSSLIGAGGIVLSDFCNLSSRVTVYSSSDDYSGSAMTNPTIPATYTAVISKAVFFGRHVIVGSGSVVLPGVTLEEGVAIGALSLVSKSCEAFGVYAGVPAKFIKERQRDLLEKEALFLLEKGSS